MFADSTNCIYIRISNFEHNLWLVCGMKIENVMIALNVMEMEVLFSIIFMMPPANKSTNALISVVSALRANSDVGAGCEYEKNHPFVVLKLSNGIRTGMSWPKRSWEIPPHGFHLCSVFKKRIYVFWGKQNAHAIFRNSLKQKNFNFQTN